MVLSHESSDDYDMYAEDYREQDEDEDAAGFGDEVAVAMVENDDEVAAETFDLPIRFPSKPALSSPAEDNIDIVPFTENPTTWSTVEESFKARTVSGLKKVELSTHTHSPGHL